MKKSNLLILILFTLFFSACTPDQTSNASLQGSWNVTSWFNNNIEEIGSGVTIRLEFSNDNAGTMKVTMNIPSDVFIYEGSFSIANGQLSSDLNETTGNSEVYRTQISGAVLFSENNLTINGNSTSYSSTAPTSTVPLVVTAEK